MKGGREREGEMQASGINKVLQNSYAKSIFFFVRETSEKTPVTITSTSGAHITKSHILTEFHQHSHFGLESSQGRN